MARKTQSLENKEPTRGYEAKNPAVALESISSAIETLSRQFITAVERLQANDQAENRQRRTYEASELKWTKRAAKAGIGFSVGSLILSALTVWILTRTLGVYQGQATIMATQAAIYNRQTTIMDQQRKIAQGQLNEMRAEQRPWLYQDTPVVTDVLVNPNTGAVFGLIFRAHNAGHLPALSARLALGIYPKGADEIVNKQRNICSGAALTQNRSLGTSIFPSESHEFKIAIGILKADWESASVTFESSGGKITGVSPILYGCFIYSAPEDPKSYATSFAYRIGRRIGRRVGTDKFDVYPLPFNPLEVPMDQIRFKPWEINSTFSAN